MKPYELLNLILLGLGPHIRGAILFVDNRSVRIGDITQADIEKSLPVPLNPGLAEKFVDTVAGQVTSNLKSWMLEKNGTFTVNGGLATRVAGASYGPEQIMPLQRNEDGSVQVSMHGNDQGPFGMALCEDEGCPHHGTKHVCVNVRDKPLWEGVEMPPPELAPLRSDVPKGVYFFDGVFYALDTGLPMSDDFQKEWWNNAYQFPTNTRDAFAQMPLPPPPREPIPEGVWIEPHRMAWGNTYKNSFYSTNGWMGQEFHDKWINRFVEFPQQPIPSGVWCVQDYTPRYHTWYPLTFVSANGWMGEPFHDKWISRAAEFPNQQVK